LTRTTSTVNPFVRYDDVHAAIDWITRVAGFEVGLTVENGDGILEHAELWFGSGVVVVNSRAQFRPEKPVFPTGPAIIDVTVDDVSAHHDVAVAQGGEVVQPVIDSVVGLNYMLRDPEGNLWAFGSYLPGTFETESST
jgi:uncharacterized glyoxalase superfamily protein PhnB